MNDLAVKTQDSAGLGSQSIVLRATAALNDVHSHALEELTQLETKITALKHAIELQSNRAQMEVTQYVELVDEALRAARSISAAVDKINATVSVQ